jgi:hypothetical protein
MKIKIILLLLALALVAPMIISGPDGNPIMTVDDWKPDTNMLAKVKQIAGLTIQAIEELTNISLSDDSLDTGNVMHKWQDAEGLWHFSDSIPEDSQVKNLTTGEMPKLANDTIVAAKVTIATNNKNEASELPSSPLVSPTKVAQLKSDSENIKQMAQQRADTLESM